MQVISFLYKDLTKVLNPTSSVRQNKILFEKIQSFEIFPEITGTIKKWLAWDEYLGLDNIEKSAPKPVAIQLLHSCRTY